MTGSGEQALWLWVRQRKWGIRPQLTASIVSRDIAMGQWACVLFNIHVLDNPCRGGGKTAIVLK